MAFAVVVGTSSWPPLVDNSYSEPWLLPMPWTVLGWGGMNHKDLEVRHHLLLQKKSFAIICCMMSGILSQPLEASEFLSSCHSVASLMIQISPVMESSAGWEVILVDCIEVELGNAAVSLLVEG
jgi:hypothetical protein